MSFFCQRRRALLLLDLEAIASFLLSIHFSLKNLDNINFCNNKLLIINLFGSFGVTITALCFFEEFNLILASRLKKNEVFLLALVWAGNPLT